MAPRFLRVLLSALSVTLWAWWEGTKSEYSEEGIQGRKTGKALRATIWIHLDWGISCNAKREDSINFSGKKRGVLAFPAWGTYYSFHELILKPENRFLESRRGSFQSQTRHKISLCIQAICQLSVVLHWFLHNEEGTLEGVLKIHCPTATAWVLVSL